VAKVTKATGIKKIVEWIAGEDCGCKERQEALNKLEFRWRYTKAQCLTQTEYEWLHPFIEKTKNTVEHKDQVTLIEIYNRVFSDKKKVSTCGPCVQELIDDLKKVHNLYVKQQ